MAHKKEQPAWAEKWEETIQWKGAMARLGVTGNDAKDRHRLFRMVANVGGTILQREGGDLAKVLWGLGGNYWHPISIRSG